MSDEAALLSAIRAARDDDTPRLVYADWLEEHGDPARAEFIRVQCWLSANDLGHPEWDVYLIREMELFVEHSGRWNSPLTGYLGAPTVRYDRGFPSWFYVHNPIDFAEVASELVRMTATDRLRIGWSNEASLIPLLTDPTLVAIRELQISVEGPALGSDATDKLVRSEHVQKLIRLDLSGRDMPNDQPGVDVLTRKPVLPLLEHLHLAFNEGYPHREHLFDLIRSPHRERLHGLALWVLDERTLFELAALPEMARFTHLDLGYSEVTDEAARRLAASPFLDRIELLTIPGRDYHIFSETGRTALRERFAHRVVLDPGVLSNGSTNERHYYRTVTGRRA